VAVPDVPAYARCSHATSALVHDDEVWQHRYSHLSLDVPDVDNIVATLEANANSQAAQRRNVLPPTISVDDDFGDFATGMDVVTAAPDEMGDFVGGFDALSMIPQRKSTANSLLPPPTPTFARHPFLTKYVRMHTVLRTLTRCLTSPAHIILSTLSSALASTPLEEAKLLRVLSLFLSPFVQPIRAWASLYTSLRSAMDRFDATLLAAFDVADEKGNEYEMKQAAEASWQVWDRNGEWEMGKVWMEKREIFYKQGTWNPDENFT
jgi:recyclin-1